MPTKAEVELQVRERIGNRRMGTKKQGLYLLLDHDGKHLN